MIPPIRRWPIPRLLAAGEVGDRELLRRFRVDPPGIVREVAGRRLSALVSHRIPTIAPDLKPFLSRELGAVAQRRAALQTIDQLGVKALVFKGAANALSYYPSETLRSSQDLDILLHPADIEAMYPGELAQDHQAHDHLPRKAFAGFATEVHYRIGTHSSWGSPEDIFADSIALADFANLRQPAPHIALTIALLHMYKHYGRMPFDSIDIAMLRGIDWSAAETLWIDRELLPLIMPGLLAYLRTSQTPPKINLDRLWTKLSAPESAWVELFAWHLLDQRFSFIREQRLRCHKHGYGFVEFCLRELLGSPEATTQLTGYPVGDFRHRYYHYMGLPIRRVCRVFRSR